MLKLFYSTSSAGGFFSPSAHKHAPAGIIKLPAGVLSLVIIHMPTEYDKSPGPEKLEETWECAEYLLHCNQILFCYNMLENCAAVPDDKGFLQ